MLKKSKSLSQLQLAIRPRRLMWEKVFKEVSIDSSRRRLLRRSTWIVKRTKILRRKFWVGKIKRWKDLPVKTYLKSQFHQKFWTMPAFTGIPKPVTQITRPLKMPRDTHLPQTRKRQEQQWLQNTQPLLIIRQCINTQVKKHKIWRKRTHWKKFWEPKDKLQLRAITTWRNQTKAAVCKRVKMGYTLITQVRW